MPVYQHPDIAELFRSSRCRSDKMRSTNMPHQVVLASESLPAFAGVFAILRQAVESQDGTTLAPAAVTGLLLMFLGCEMALVVPFCLGRGIAVGTVEASSPTGVGAAPFIVWWRWGTGCAVLGGGGHAVEVAGR